MNTNAALKATLRLLPTCGLLYSVAAGCSFKNFDHLQEGTSSDVGGSGTPGGATNIATGGIGSPNGGSSTGGVSASPSITATGGSPSAGAGSSGGSASSTEGSVSGFSRTAISTPRK